MKGDGIRGVEQKKPPVLAAEDELLLMLDAANVEAKRWGEEETRWLQTFSFRWLAVLAGVVALVVFGIAKMF